DIHMRSDDLADVAVAADHGMRDGMYAPYCAIGKKDSKIKLEAPSPVLDSLAHHFAKLLQVVWRNTRLDGLYRNSLFRVEAKQTIDFGGAIHIIATADVPGPAAHTTEMLGVGQIGLATAKLLFRLLCSRDVHHSSD